MTKKIVIQVHVECDKCRSKAFKIAAGYRGVTSVVLGESGDEVVITGDEVDPVYLTSQMRKKLHQATLISVEDINSDEGDDNEGDVAGGELERETTPGEDLWVAGFGNHPPPCPMYHVMYDPYPNNSFSIL